MFFARALLCSGLTLLACVPASAQGQGYRPERPYRGIFGSGVGDFGQTLTVNTTVSGGYDDNVLADATRRETVQNSQEGVLAQFSGGLNYNLTGERGMFTAGAGASLRHYPTLQNDSFRTYNANIAGVYRLLRRPNLTVHQSVSYQPFTFLSGVAGPGVDPGLDPVVPPEPDYVPLAAHYMSYESGADLDAQLTRRVSYLSSYTYRLTDRNSNDYWRQSGSAGLRFGLTRDVSLRTVYRYTEAHYTGRIVRTHSPDIGLDFARALSLTRRTNLGFGAGVEATAVNDQTRYRATGHANVTHEIGRSWMIDGGYRRGTYYIDTLPEPIFGDTARLGVGGLLTRRLQFNAAAYAQIGDAGVGGQRQYDSYRGTASLSMALNRFMNVGGDFVYYRYIYDQSIQLDPGLSHEVNRRSIRAHVSFWAPLMNRTRRRDASR